MAKTKYKPGDVFNYWTLLNKPEGSKQWLAKCICGKEKLVWIDHLSSGRSISCSCKGKATHGLSSSPEYNSWSSAKSRCLNENDDRWDSYGGRGIRMCDRWIKSFSDFIADMGRRPEGMTLERIDVDGDYCPENCKWATPKQQQNNRRIHKVNGLGKSILETSEELGIPYGRLQARLYRGWSVDDAKNPGTFKDKGVRALAKEHNISECMLRSRLSRGWDLDKALTTPPYKGRNEIPPEERLERSENMKVRRKGLKFTYV